MHHGHQRGIIHRDLKPSNILVDSQGQPRIIDFGVARATDSDMALTTLQTDVGQLLGTLQYMSPEQCEADPDDIDTRSDIYALGVVLYDLLCGELPYDVRRLPALEAARLIREGPPTKPSKEMPALRGDVETVVMKALQRDRDQRYQSAHGLAQDIRRYLNGEAIAARPPSLTYQLRVFARRNRTLLAAAAVVFFVLIAGVAVSTSLYIEAKNARVRAEQEKQNAIASMNFLHDMVNSVDPRRIGLDIKVTELLDGYSENIEQAFPGQPEVESAVRVTISRSYSTLDLFEKRPVEQSHREAAKRHLVTALSLREQALGPDHPQTLETVAELASLLQGYGEVSEAKRLHLRALESRERVFGPDHPDTLESMYDFADFLHDQAQIEEAIALARETLEARRNVLGGEHRSTIESILQLAELQRNAGRLTEAEQLNRQALETSRHAFDEEEYITKFTRNELAATLLAQAKRDEAESLYGSARIPDDIGIEHWFQGELDLDAGQPTVVALWEPWCPISFRQLPRVQETYAKYQDRGLRALGLTRMTLGSTEENVLDFIRDKQLTFPMAKVKGSTSTEYFNPGGGVPAAAVILDGKLLWRGMPNSLSDRMFEGLMGAPRRDPGSN